MKAYYEDGSVTIYHGDNRLILPALPEFDLLCTDPPYGIGESSAKVASRRKLAAPKDYGVFNWDKAPVEPWVMELARSKARKQIIFGGNYYTLPPTSCWLIWDKENSGDFADGEMAWTNLQKAMRIKRHMWNGMLRKGQEERFHPTQKPLDVMLWALSFAPDAVTVLDPWGGSGTTARACKDLGKQCVLIEREEANCEIAAKRMAQEALAL